MSDCKHEEWSEWIMNPNCQGRKIISKYRDCLGCGDRERIWKSAVETEEDFIKREPKLFDPKNIEHMASPEEQLQHVLKCHKIYRERLERTIKDYQERNKELNKEVARLEKTNWKKKYDKLREKTDEMRTTLREAIYDDEDYCD